ncbi:D-2-hydroxyacid dehydrogenase family protein [Acidisphaera sp. L21]|uniref:D-2-hydroxyacid dehydrogenase family protein n=1 Tax=Acidisphaera sp. L21 TaxID=1641851 RepID=UPI00131AD039|nr:D-2-hydroxyacid dehydrogenase family protein [Acidisphaera sp. L21]
MTKIAVLDDYQGVAFDYADWAPVKTRADISIFRDNLADPDALVQRLLPFDAIAVMRERTPLPRAILERLPNLKFISSTGARNASIDMAAAKDRGIAVSATGYNASGAIEMTWALLHAAARHIPEEIASFRNGGWQVAVGADLRGSTLGLMGLGSIGKAVAKVGLAFGMNAIAWSQNLTAEAAAAVGVRLVDKETLLKEADFLTVHLVLSDRSRGIIGAPDLALMKPTAWLVNTSRGPLVDEAALIDVLERKAIAGAALDVYDVEPLPVDNVLRTLGNVVASPHVGFVTSKTYAIFFKDTVENLVAWMDGSPIRVM